MGREAGLPPEGLVLEMYQSGEMEEVFASFREHGFPAASEARGPTAVFGGLSRTLELDRADIAARFRAEARDGYPLLALARAMIHGRSPLTEAESRLRRRAGP